MEQDRLQITGAWTKAGIASCMRVQGPSKQDDFLLDCGFYCAETTCAKYVLVSHGHIDHVGACIAHARGKALLSGSAVYYVPQEIVAHLNEAKAAFEKLDDAPIPMNIVGVSPGDEFRIGTNLKVKVFPTLHRVPSQGYAIYALKKGELLPELKGLSGAEIRELKQMGQAICGPDREELEMVYTGDTTMAGLVDNPDNAHIFSAHTFIVEVTYLDGDRQKALEWGHVHLDDVIDHAHLFEAVQRLVFVHISQKYSLSRIVKILQDRLPESLQRKVLVSLHSFGASEPLSRLTDSCWGQQQRGTAGWGWSNPIGAPSGHNTSSGGGGGGRDGYGYGGGRGGGCRDQPYRGGSYGGRGGSGGGGGGRPDWGRGYGSGGRGGGRGGGDDGVGGGGGGGGWDGNSVGSGGSGGRGYNTGDKRGWGSRQGNQSQAPYPRAQPQGRQGQQVRSSGLPLGPPFAAPVKGSQAQDDSAYRSDGEDASCSVRKQAGAGVTVPFSMEDQLELSDDSHDKRAKLRHSASAPDVAGSGRRVYASTSNGNSSSAGGDRGGYKDKGGES